MCCISGAWGRVAGRGRPGAVPDRSRGSHSPAPGRDPLRGTHGGRLDRNRKNRKKLTKNGRHSFSKSEICGVVFLRVRSAPIPRGNARKSESRQHRREGPRLRFWVPSGGCWWPIFVRIHRAPGTFTAPRCPLPPDSPRGRVVDTVEVPGTSELHQTPIPTRRLEAPTPAARQGACGG